MMIMMMVVMMVVVMMMIMMIIMMMMINQHHHHHHHHHYHHHDHPPTTTPTLPILISLAQHDYPERWPSFFTDFLALVKLDSTYEVLGVAAVVAAVVVV